MVDEVSTLVTPSLHPENVKKIDGYSEETAAVLGPTEETLRLAYRSVEDVFKARAAASLNPTWNEAAQAIATQEYADKVFDKVARSFDSTRDRLVKGIASLEKELSAPVESKASLQVSQEVRAHFKTLPTEKRMSLLRKAIVEGDHTTATAVLGAPSYLSGFTPEMQAVMLRDYHTRHSPHVANRLRAMEGAKAMLESRSSLVFSELERAVGMPPHKVKKLREAKDAAEQAMVLRDVA